MSEPDSISWVRFAFASATVIALMSLLGWGLKFAATRGILMPRKARDKRLRVKDSLFIDGRHRLVIAQCDDMDYHLLLGANGDLLLSSRPTPPTDRTDEKLS